jgi:hypothetical protein
MRGMSARQAAPRDRGPFTLAAIGWVSSAYQRRFGTPQQASAVDSDATAVLVLDPDKIPPEALADLAGMDRIWVLSLLNRGARLVAAGVSAARAPAAAWTILDALAGSAQSHRIVRGRIGARRGLRSSRAGHRSARRHADPRYQALCAVCGRVPGGAGRVDRFDPARFAAVGPAAAPGGHGGAGVSTTCAVTTCPGEIDVQSGSAASRASTAKTSTSGLILS